MRVALLQADWVNPEFIGPHGDLGDMVGRFLDRHVAGPVTIETFRILEGERPASAAGYDLLLIPGSRYSAYDDFPGKDGLIALLHEAYCLGANVLGLCFGAQLIAHAFGGEVAQSEYGWNVGLHPSAVLRQPARLGPLPERATLLFNHRDRIRALPSGFEPFLASERCPIAGFHHRGRIVGLQFHPEYTLDYQEALMSVSKTLEPEDREDAIRRNRRLHSTAGTVTRPVLAHLCGAAA